MKWHRTCREGVEFGEVHPHIRWWMGVDTHSGALCKRAKKVISFFGRNGVQLGTENPGCAYGPMSV